jgi:N6-L-threonylcarbamoyladenine synthase
MKNLILGIETSCDDTSLALLEKLPNNQFKLLATRSFSQEDLLKKFGGVIPEVAARNHLLKIQPLLLSLLADTQAQITDIKMIGVSTLPGLLGPLMIGLNTAKNLALFLQIPIVPVNHLFAHLNAINLHENIPYPFLGLLVSGGHSAYFLVEGPNQFTTLGSTIDDAAGEAFDKGGKLLGLGYPAGHLIDFYAKSGDPHKFAFTIGLKDSKDCRLSFSGIKTSLRLFLEKHSDPIYHFDQNHPNPSQEFKDLCASYQKGIVDALILKLGFADKKVGGKLPIVVGGGVASNSYLRKILQEKFPNGHFVKPEFCTDNGAMIAFSAFLNQEHAIHFPKCLDLDVQSRYFLKSDFIHVPINS